MRGVSAGDMCLPPKGTLRATVRDSFQLGIRVAKGTLRALNVESYKKYRDMKVEGTPDTSA